MLEWAFWWHTIENLFRQKSNKEVLECENDFKLQKIVKLAFNLICSSSPPPPLLRIFTLKTCTGDEEESHIYLQPDDDDRADSRIRYFIWLLLLQNARALTTYNTIGN